MIKKIMSLLIVFMLVGGVAFAEIADKFVVINYIAYSLDYINADENRLEIVEVLKNSNGNIYIFDNGEWYDNNGEKLSDKVAIAYTNKEGVFFAVTGIEENSDSEVEENTEIEEEVFDYHIVSERIKLKGDKILLRNELDFKYYELGTAVTPDLNDKVYKLFKYYLESNNRENIITGAIMTERGNPEGYRFGGIELCENFYNQREIISFGFADVKTIDWLYDSNFYLEISSLHDSKGLEEGEDWYFTDHYLYKLNRTIQILFEDKDYSSIYDHILQEYRNSINNTFKNEKVIDGITIITEKTQDTNFEVYFKY